jgi:hypothetical protein
MAKMLVFASIGMIATLTAISGAYADNPSVPSWSPYAIMGYDAAPPAASSRMETFRAAQVDRRNATDATVPNTNVPNWTPYAIMPMGL